jgi:hypothetical protein
MWTWEGVTGYLLALSVKLWACGANFQVALAERCIQDDDWLNDQQVMHLL